MKNWLKSSQNPEQVSNTVRGAILLTSGTLLLIARVLNFPLTEADITEVAGQLGAGAGSVWFIYGLFMKVVMFFGKK